MKKFIKNNFENLTVNELENLLNKELKKPAGFIDSEFVENITDALCIKENLKIAPASDETVSEVVQSIISSERVADKKRKHIVCKVSACAAALLIGLNVCTVSAYNESVFSLLVEFTKKSVMIQFNEPKEEIIIPVSADDPYGIIAKCKEADIENVETPHYIPEGFILTVCEIDNEDENGMRFAGFTYENGKQLISINYDKLPDLIPERIGIPSDEHNITEIQVNGHTAIMSREDDQMNTIFAYDDKVIDIMTINVDYSECDKILESCK